MRGEDVNVGGKEQREGDREKGDGPDRQRGVEEV